MARTVLILVSGVVLAAVLALQAASGVFAKPNPALASQLMPVGNESLNRLLSASMRGSVKTEADIPKVAAQLAPLAKQAASRGPLGPEAHAILIINEADAEKRTQMLVAASALNRRDLLLQGLVLQDNIGRSDFAGTISVLDEMLRVRPQQKLALFPALYNALRDERSLPAFAQVLDGTSLWHDDFLVSAARDSDSIEQLANLRPQLNRKVPEFDRLLVRRLVQAGDLETANAVYLASTGQATTLAGAGKLSWGTDLAPFDWSLQDDAGFRALPIRDGAALEIFARGGKGGIIAERLISPPAAPFGITIEQDITPADQLRDVRLQLRCRGASDPFLDERFSAGTNVFRVDALPAGCDYVMLGINARAWSGRSPLRGTIDSITIAK